VNVHGDELLGFLASDRGDGAEKVDELFGMVPLRIKEIEAILRFFDIDGVFMGRMFQDQLFEI